MFVADGKNERMYVMDRVSMEILTSFGEGGRQPGQWFAVHSFGKRFLITIPNLGMDGSGSLKIHVVLNWIEDVKRRLATGH